MNRWIALTLGFVVCLTNSYGQTPSEMVIFGDSLSDTGNSFATTGIPPGGAAGFPYFQGRFSNGPIWIDYLQADLELPDQAVQNYAVGGASTGFGFKEPPAGIFETPPGTLIPTVGAQIDLYLLSDAPRDNQLFILWAGSNDLFNESLPGSVVNNLEQHIRTLASAGATEFLVSNLTPLGETPAVDGTFEGFVLNIFTRRFNRKIKRELKSLEDELGITIHRLDVYTLTVLGLIFPDVFGITNTKNAALADIQAGLITPQEGASYLYWDIIHPTSLAHQNIAAEALRILAK